MLALAKIAKKKEQALNYFSQKSNCSQAVAGALMVLGMKFGYYHQVCPQMIADATENVEQMIEEYS